jgi:hypothetical protein
MRRADEVPPEFRRRNPPTIRTGNDLRSKEFPPLSWVVPDILPAGVTLFGGREKMGKSWLAFSLCIGVTTGGYALGKMPVEGGESLYLSLEDPERRLHKRIRRLAHEDVDLGGFHYATEWPTIDRGGLEDLEAWLEEHPNTRLVVIDTLKRIRPRASSKLNMYDVDYDALRPFVPLADKHDVAIVLIHHLNQQSEPHDPFDAFSGSAGLPAAADDIWLLTRKRGDADAYLMVDGKDIEEPQELALGWDAATCCWTAKGDAATYRLNKERREIVEAMTAWDEPMGPKAVSDALGKDYDQTRQLMYKMAGDGQLTQEGYGKYVVARGPVYIDNIGNTSTNGLGVNNVNDVNAPYVRNGHSPPISADEQNELFEQLVREGMGEKFAKEEVFKRMGREDAP